MRYVQAISNESTIPGGSRYLLFYIKKNKYNAILDIAIPIDYLEGPFRLTEV